MMRAGKDYRTKIAKPAGRAVAQADRYFRLHFASPDDLWAFERDLWLYGNAFVDQNGNYVPASDVNATTVSKRP